MLGKIAASLVDRGKRLLKIGQPAPVFTLSDADMETFSLASLRGKEGCARLYPRDDTPFCTREAIDFSDHEEEFTRLGCVILGVSRDDCLKHAEFPTSTGCRYDCWPTTTAK